MNEVLFIRSHLGHNLLNQWSKSAMAFCPDLHFFTFKFSTIASALTTPAKGVSSPKGLAITALLHFDPEGDREGGNGSVGLIAQSEVTQFDAHFSHACRNQGDGR